MGLWKTLGFPRGLGTSPSDPQAAFHPRILLRNQIEKLANSNLGVPRDTKKRTAAIMLLHKRNAFNFENEVRLLWLDEGVSGG